jgi:tRNA A-37 threonylcarbamoyl transferase component Bud32
VHIESGTAWGIEECRVFVKRQSDYICRPPWRAFLATPTLLREHRALLAWRKLDVGTPEIVAYRQNGTDAVLVVREVSGSQPLQEALEMPGADRNQIVINLAGALGRVHRARWVHGALYSPHILVRTEEGYAVNFIDLEKAKRSRRLRRNDLDRFWRHNRYFSAAEAALFEAEYQAAYRKPGCPTPPRN